MKRQNKKSDLWRLIEIESSKTQVAELELSPVFYVKCRKMSMNFSLQIMWSVLLYSHIKNCNFLYSWNFISNKSKCFNQQIQKNLFLKNQKAKTKYWVLCCLEEVICAKLYKKECQHYYIMHYHYCVYNFIYNARHVLFKSDRRKILF